MYINTVCVYTNTHDSNEKHLGQKKKKKTTKKWTSLLRKMVLKVLYENHVILMMLDQFFFTLIPSQATYQFFKIGSTENITVHQKFIVIIVSWHGGISVWASVVTPTEEGQDVARRYAPTYVMVEQKLFQRHYGCVQCRLWEDESSDFVAELLGFESLF